MYSSSSKSYILDGFFSPPRGISRIPSILSLNIFSISSIVLQTSFPEIFAEVEIRGLSIRPKNSTNLL